VLRARVAELEAANSALREAAAARSEVAAARLAARDAQLEAAQAQLAARVEELELRLGKDSSTSSKPVPCKIRTPTATLCFLRSLGRSPIFADQALDGLLRLIGAITSMGWRGWCTSVVTVSA
jgi:hypothetical protein